MTVRSTNRISPARVAAAVAVAGGAALALSACTPNEHPAPAGATYSTPAVVSGDQVAPGDVVNADGIGAGGDNAESATLVSQSGANVGRVTLNQVDETTVKVTADITADVKPGKHGLHIHTGKKCEPSTGFESAGDHYQAPGHTGKPESGDLMTIDVLSNGTGSASVTTEAFKAADVNGLTVILHDSDAADAPRFACGVIATSK